MIVIANACTQTPQAYGPILMANVIDENRSINAAKDAGLGDCVVTREPIGSPRAQSMFWAVNALFVKPFNSVG